VAFADTQIVAEDDDADRAFLEVEDLALGAVLELQPFTGHGAGQPIDAGDAVADFQHLADLGEVDRGAILADLFCYDRRDLVDFEFHGCSP
jgi:hypothetical protein